MTATTAQTSTTVTAPGTPAVAAENVYRFYRSGDEETLALRGVSLLVQADEFVVINGPSGSGKSTLLACLTGADEPSGGSIRIAGERINHRSQKDRDRIRASSIGVMAQSGNLVSHLRIRDNLRLAAHLADTGRSYQGAARTRTAPSWTATAEELGIGQRLDAWPEELSGGESARAALAVALAAGPLVLVADEPTGELDAHTEASLIEQLRAVAARGVAVIVASHSDAVAAGADRVVRLNEGQVVPS
ncbi:MULTISPECIES: ABC transporter ATP-binding protein [unclassified Nocardioides]|uniref:ABC transporter ATP-binding protein n=1 Tax=unclassified Nocardioides TaxID=2615069 RepID=UPI0009F0470C|nr:MULTISPECIES: ATP-binding cassette domain-containing protein [unclassified Nocardioides]GAW48981.1 ABC transporter-like protein [Nocardioides sp. PD653-B2]GAW55196.1 ABC transporter-like protein [Nocardioides sp. PD653]HWI42195.1 ATP-binding cassette domain-containing protein [Nocardioides sp.]